MNGSLIQTALGKTIYVAHDTNLPRPYDRINKIQGTRGIFQGYPDRVYIEGRPSHRWEEAETYYDDFEHPCGARSARLPSARAMEAWTSWRTIGSSSACARVCRST